MFGKKNKRIRDQAERIRELEEILCPCEQHDFIKTGFHLEGGSIGAADTVNHFICKRCKKRVQSRFMP